MMDGVLFALQYQPVIVCRFEASSIERMTEIKDLVISKLKEIGDSSLMSDISSFQDHFSFIRSQTEKGLAKIPLKPNLSNYFYDPIDYVLKR
ncbi:MAG: hypothetical protein Ct9H90mP20_6880 [Candidatus Neomarinimicrobiota bacterium]|nr:MAG: hypothetical protein Ct9H90mP20_6880 [Candidatus Neomarinimicrobiota bacterium]